MYVTFYIKKKIKLSSYEVNKTYQNLIHIQPLKYYLVE